MEQRPRTPRDRPPPRDPYDDYEEISLLALFGVLLRHRWVVVGTSVVLAAVVVLWSLLLTPRTWTSTASFTPQAGEQASGRLEGLASQFGVSLPSGGNASETPGFYADLLRT